MQFPTSKIAIPIAIVSLGWSIITWVDKKFDARITRPEFQELSDRVNDLPTRDEMKEGFKGLKEQIDELMRRDRRR